MPGQIESMIFHNGALNGQAGVVTFTVSGSLLNSGSGLTAARLAYRVTPQSLPGDPMFIASVNQNSTPLLSFVPVENNWVLSPGSLTGSASYRTGGLSMVFGSAFDLDVAPDGVRDPALRKWRRRYVRVGAPDRH